MTIARGVLAVVAGVVAAGAVVAVTEMLIHAVVAGDALLGAVAVTALGATVAAPSLLSSFPAQAAQIAGQPAPSTIAPAERKDISPKNWVGPRVALP